MARLARVVAPGYPDHVTQRGNRRMVTFFCDDDYRAYLSLLVAWCGRCGVRIGSYCLMPNHVHLILAPDTNTLSVECSYETQETTPDDTV